MPNLNFDQKFYTKDNQQHSEYQGVAVTPADGTDLPNGACDAIYATGAGNIVIQAPNVTVASGATTAQSVTLPVAAGSIIFCRASRILSTSTTATGIYALYKANGTL
jgi:bifunctional ADP-heptose synthase (sugar kinase/adenylyltransferase)